MTDRYLLTVDTGMVVMPRPTGRWERDERGFWREIYTDKVIINADGSERSREPYRSLAAIAAEEGPFDERGPVAYRQRLAAKLAQPRRTWRNLWGAL